MAWIYRAKNGDLMFSKTKPEKVYRFYFRNNEFYEDGEGKWNPFVASNKIITIDMTEDCFDSSGTFKMIDYKRDPEIIKVIHIDECVFEGDYNMGFPITLKPETVAALKSIVDLNLLTVEDGLIEI